MSVTPQAAHDAAHEAARDTAAGNAPAMAAGLAASPFLFLTSINFINWLGFAAWQALLNNFAREQAGFDGAAIGILQ
ncbi:MAG: hypothetical protein ACRCYS_08440, partial [Beijerinckiaceae bacterium]